MNWNNLSSCTYTPTDHLSDEQHWAYCDVFLCLTKPPGYLERDKTFLLLYDCIQNRLLHTTAFHCSMQYETVKSMYLQYARSGLAGLESGS